MIQPNVSALENDEIKFDNCVIFSSNSYLIIYYPNNYTKGNYTKVIFNNCNISSYTNVVTFAYGYAKPSKGYLELNNCMLYLPNLTVFFDCYPQYLENIENFNINFINTPINNSISILCSYLQNNNHINIKVS